MDETSQTDRGAARAQTAELRQELERTRRVADQFALTLTRGFRDIVVRGRGVSDTLKSIALRFTDVALKAALKPLENVFSQLITGLPGAPGQSGGLPALANGGASAQRLPIPFARGGVVAAPTLFPMAQGRTGLMGERGAEAILPLARGPDGRLGVQASAPTQAITINFNVSSPDAEGFKRSEAQLSAMLARAVAQGQRNL